MNVSPSAGASVPGGGLPVVNQALEPAWVRHGSAATQKSYETALAFETTLVEELSRSLTATSGLGGESGQEGESSGEAGSSAMGAGGPLSSMLPQALASGVMNAGGLGLAAQMTRSLDDSQGVADTSAVSAQTLTRTGASTAPGSPAKGEGR
jgi:hypothetical protein